MQALLSQFAGLECCVIGMLHAPALPGSPRYGGDLMGVIRHVLRDAQTLADGGVHGLMLENFGDVPFFPGRVPPHTLAALTALACHVRQAVDLPLGINLLRNDACGALSIAVASGASFIRVNILCGARVTDQGLIQGVAHDLLRLRARLGAKDVRIMADVDVKHSAAIAARPLAEEVEDTVHRGLADALIVSGAGTGKTTDPAKVQAVRQAAPATPIFVGSGVGPDNSGAYLTHADGFIVGTAFKRNGQPGNPVELKLVRQFVRNLPGGRTGRP